MTSTNDGEDVKSNQTSGQKGKTYYIELYKALDGQLNAEGSLSERVGHLSAAWRRVHTLCLHSAPTTHPHLLTWIQRHTARTVLQSEWQSPTSKDEHTRLEEAINDLTQECQNAATDRDGIVLPWEYQLLARAHWFRNVLSNPWEHPVLKALLDPKGEHSAEEILEWLKEERGVVFAARLRQLALSKCDDLALALLTPVMDIVRASRRVGSELELAEEEGKETPEAKRSKPTFESILSTEAGFSEVWDLLTDMEYVLLHKSDRNSRVIDLAKVMPLCNGYQVVERLLNRLEAAPKEKRLWKNAKDVATLITQVVITRCMVIPVCTGAVRTALYWCGRALVRAVAASSIARALATLAAPAASARHLHTLATAVHAQQSAESEELKPFVVELYVRAITFGMNELEKLKLKPEYEEKEARATEQTLASWFIQLGHLLSSSARMKCECTLTAFSVHPSPAMYERITRAPPLPPRAIDTTQTKPEPETKSEFGSWASDSRSQTNLVKTSEHLNMQQKQHQANVLSTAILNEGEALGLDAELCQDIIVLLSGPRVKTLSWDVDRQVLLENCRAYMERTQSGTRALTTELKYLNLDPRHYQHLPEDEDDEDDLYYGIEKGYEHLVELEPQPEEIWEDAYYDFERTETAPSSDERDTPTRRKKKTKHRKSDSDSDPLSLVAEKKKERPHSKERSKERKKKPKDADKSKDVKDVKDKDKEHAERRKDESKDKKKEKKERKKREKKAKHPLIGTKLTKIMTEDSGDSGNESKSKASGENIEYDGQFSMDELKSPERPKDISNKNISPRNQSPLLEARQLAAAALQKAYTKQMSINENASSQAKSSPTSSPASTSHIPTMGRGRQALREEVKKGISKLLQFRRQKMSEASNSPLSSPNQTESSCSTTTPQSPMIGTKLSNQNVILNKNHQGLLTTMKSEAKTYKAIKAIFYPPTRKKISCSRVQPFHPALAKNNPRFNPQAYSTSHPSEALNLSQQKPIILNNTLNQLSQQNQEFRSQPQATITSPRVSDSTHLSSYEKFLQDLERNPDAGLDPLSPPKEPSKKKKQLKPVSRVTPVVPLSFNTESNMTTTAPNVVKTEDRINHNIENIKTEPNVTQATHPVVKQEPMISHQSAKPVVQPKKVENAPNTFARLSYMHKNKLNDKSKQQLDATLSLQTSISEELDRRIAELRVSKKHVRKNNEYHSSRVNITAAKPKPAKVEVQKIPTHTPHQQQNLLLINMLNNVGLTAKSSNDAHKVTHKPPVVTTPTNTSLTEKDQQDLLRLLGQQNILNMPQSKINSQPSTIVNTPQFTNSSKTESNKSSVETGMPLQANRFLASKSVPVPEQAQAIENKRKIPVHFDGTSFNFPVIPNTTVMKTATMVQNKTPTNRQRKTKPKIAKQVNVEQNKTVVEVNKEIAKKYEPKAPVPTSTFDPDGEEQDWTKVLDAIRSYKTPSRGPNALDIVLKKDSFEKVNERNQPINSPSPVTTVNNSLKQTPPTSTQVNRPTQPKESSKESTSHTSVLIQNRSMLKKHATDLPKKQHVSAAKKNAPLNPIVLYPEVTKQSQLSKLQKEVDPFISGIPNADYEILEELMDDDLRQEIGELSSDEERYAPPAEPKSKGCKNDESKNSTCIKNIIPAKKQDLGTWIRPSELTMPISSEVPQNTKNKPVIISNEKVDFRKLSKNLIGSKIVRQEPTTMASKLQSGIIYNVKNTLVSNTVTSTTTSTVIFNAAPQPAVTSMVIIDPFGMASNVNQNYVAVDNASNVVFQRFTAPVAASQIIIGNNYIPTVTTPASTATVVYNTNNPQIIPNNVPLMHIPEATSMPTISMQTNITKPNKSFDSANVKQFESTSDVQTGTIRKPKADDKLTNKVPTNFQQSAVDPKSIVAMPIQQNTNSPILIKKDPMSDVQSGTIRKPKANDKLTNTVPMNFQQGAVDLKSIVSMPIQQNTNSPILIKKVPKSDVQSGTIWKPTADDKLINKVHTNLQQSAVDLKSKSSMPIQQNTKNSILIKKGPIIIQQGTADSKMIKKKVHSRSQQSASNFKMSKKALNKQSGTDSKLTKNLAINIQQSTVDSKLTQKFPINIQQSTVDPKLTKKITINSPQSTADPNLIKKTPINQQSTADPNLIKKTPINFQQSTANPNSTKTTPINFQQSTADPNLTKKTPINFQQSTADPNSTKTTPINFQQSTADPNLTKKTPINFQQSTADPNLTKKTPINFQQSTADPNLTKKTSINFPQSTADPNLTKKTPINFPKSSADPNLTKKTPINFQQSTVDPQPTEKITINIQQSIADPRLTKEVPVYAERNISDTKLFINKVEMNSTKTNERKVLSEVQEKLTKPKVEMKFPEKNDPANIKNQRPSLESDKNETECLHKIRLTKKRLAIMHRNTNHRSIHPAIPLAYVPLHTLQQVEDSPKLEESKKPKPEITFHNATNQPPVIAQNIKDNEVNNSCPRKLLRSSNKVETAVVPKSNTKVGGRKTKVRLKNIQVTTASHQPADDVVSSVIETTLEDAILNSTTNAKKTNQHSASEVIENLEEKVKVSTEKPSVPTRVSKRILNNKIMKSKEKEVKSETKSTLQNTENKVLNTSSKNEKLDPVTKQQAFDVEDAIIGIIIPKTNDVSGINIHTKDQNTKGIINPMKNKALYTKEIDVSPKEVVKETIEMLSSPEICETNPLDLMNKAIDKTKTRIGTEKIETTAKSESFMTTSKTEEVSVLEKTSLKKLDNDTNIKKSSEALPLETAPVDFEYKFMGSNKINKLVDDIESAICAITESTMRSPLLETLDDKDVIDEVKTISQNTDLKETAGTHVTLLANDISAIPSGNHNKIMVNTAPMQCDISDENGTPSIIAVNSKTSLTKTVNEQTKKSVEGTGITKYTFLSDEDSKTRNSHIVTEKVPVDSVKHQVPKVDKIRIKITKPEQFNKCVYEIEKMDLAESKSVDDKSIHEKESLSLAKQSVDPVIDQGPNIDVNGLKSNPPETQLHVSENTAQYDKTTEQVTPDVILLDKKAKPKNINKRTKAQCKNKKTSVKTIKETTPKDKAKTIEVYATDESVKSNHAENKASFNSPLHGRPFLRSVIENEHKDVISLSSESELDKMTSNKDLRTATNNNESELDKMTSNKDLRTTTNSSVGQPITDEVPQSYKDSIKIEEITIPGNTNPLKRCVRIVLPNNKVFKATVHGKVNVSFDTLFEEPALKNTLLSSLKDKKRYLLNIQQLSTTDHRIVDTKIQGIDVPKKKTPIQSSEVVNLISDDEDELYQTINTEFGSYKIKNLDQDILKKHQERLSQKCALKLHRCDDKRKTEKLVQALLDDLANISPAPSEVIEIDDSSSDGESSQVHTGIDILKDMLLKELGVMLPTQNNLNDEQQGEIISENQRPSRTRKSKYHRERDPRTVSVETKKRSLQPKRSESSNTSRDQSIDQDSGKFAKQDSLSEIKTRDFSVKLINCDNLVKEMEQKAQARADAKQLNDEVIALSSDEDDVSVMSRSGSFSILNELDILDEPVTPLERESSPVMRAFEIIHALRELDYSGKKSPVMEVYDMIVSLQNKPPRSAETPEKSYKTENDMLCKSEWFETKRCLRMKYSIDRTRTTDDIFQEIVQNKLNICTDCETDAATDLSITDCEYIHTENPTVPSLTSIMSKYFEDNPIVHQLKSISTMDGLPKTPHKRKLLEPAELIDRTRTIDDIFQEIVQNKLDISTDCETDAATDLSITDCEYIHTENPTVPSLTSVMSKYFEDNPIVHQLKSISTMDGLPKTLHKRKLLEPAELIDRTRTIDDIFQEIVQNKLDISTDCETDAATDLSITDCEYIHTENPTVPSLTSIMSKYFEDNPIVHQLKSISTMDGLPKTPHKRKLQEPAESIDRTRANADIFQEIVQNKLDIFTDCEADAATDLSITDCEYIYTENPTVPSLTSIMSKYFEDNPIVHQLKSISTMDGLPKTSHKRKLQEPAESASNKLSRLMKTHEDEMPMFGAMIEQVTATKKITLIHMSTTSVNDINVSNVTPSEELHIQPADDLTPKSPCILDDYDDLTLNYDLSATDNAKSIEMTRIEDGSLNQEKENILTVTSHSTTIIPKDKIKESYETTGCIEDLNNVSSTETANKETRLDVAVGVLEMITDVPETPNDSCALTPRESMIENNIEALTTDEILCSKYPSVFIENSKDSAIEFTDEVLVTATRKSHCVLVETDINIPKDVQRTNGMGATEISIATSPKIYIKDRAVELEDISLVLVKNIASVVEEVQSEAGDEVELDNSAEVPDRAISSFRAICASEPNMDHDVSDDTISPEESVVVPTTTVTSSSISEVTTSTSSSCAVIKDAVETNIAHNKNGETIALQDPILSPERSKVSTKVYDSKTPMSPCAIIEKETATNVILDINKKLALEDTTVALERSVTSTIISDAKAMSPTVEDAPATDEEQGIGDILVPENSAVLFVTTKTSITLPEITTPVSPNTFVEQANAMHDLIDETVVPENSTMKISQIITPISPTVSEEASSTNKVEDKGDSLIAPHDSVLSETTEISTTMSEVTTLMSPRAVVEEEPATNTVQDVSDNSIIAEDSAIVFETIEKSITVFEVTTSTAEKTPAAIIVQNASYNSISPEDSVMIFETIEKSSTVCEVTTPIAEEIPASNIVQDNSITPEVSAVGFETTEKCTVCEVTTPLSPCAVAEETPEIVQDLKDNSTIQEEFYVESETIEISPTVLEQTTPMSPCTVIEEAPITSTDQIINDDSIAPEDSAEVSDTIEVITTFSEVTTVVKEVTSTNIVKDFKNNFLTLEDTAVVSEAPEILTAVSGVINPMTPCAVVEEAPVTSSDQIISDISIAPGHSSEVSKTVKISSIFPEVTTVIEEITSTNIVQDTSDNSLKLKDTAVVSEITETLTTVSRVTKIKPKSPCTVAEAVHVSYSFQNLSDNLVTPEDSIVISETEISTNDNSIAPKESIVSEIEIYTIKNSIAPEESNVVPETEVSSAAVEVTIPMSPSAVVKEALATSIVQGVSDISIAPEDSIVLSETEISTNDNSIPPEKSSVSEIEISTNKKSIAPKEPNVVSETEVSSTAFEVTIPVSPSALVKESPVTIIVQDISNISVTPKDCAVVLETSVVSSPVSEVTIPESTNSLVKTAVIAKLGIDVEDDSTVDSKRNDMSATICQVTTPTSLNAFVQDTFTTNAYQGLSSDYITSKNFDESTTTSEEEKGSLHQSEADDALALKAPVIFPETATTVVEDIIDKLQIQDTETSSVDSFCVQVDVTSASKVSDLSELSIIPPEDSTLVTMISTALVETASMTNQEDQDIKDNAAFTTEDSPMVSETNMAISSTVIGENLFPSSKEHVHDKVTPEKSNQEIKSSKSSSALLENRDLETTIESTENDIKYEPKLNTDKTISVEINTCLQSTVQSMSEKIDNPFNCNTENMVNSNTVQTDVMDNNNFKVCDHLKESPEKSSVDIIYNSVSSSSPVQSKVTKNVVDMDKNYVYETEILVEVQDETNELDEITKSLPSQDQFQLVTSDSIENNDVETRSECIDDDEEIIVEKTIEEVDCDENVFGRNATLVYKDDSGVVLKGIEYEDPEIGTCYVFPLVKSTDESGTSEVLNSSVGSTIEVIQEVEISTEVEDTEVITELYDEQDLKLIRPKQTYSKRNLKRKSNMRDVPCSEKRSRRNSRSRESTEIKITERKYRKGKNIDMPKLSATAIAESGNVKDFKRRLDYYSTVGFSYSIPYSTEFIDATDLLNKWPINGPIKTETQDQDENDHTLFVDLDKDNHIRDPLRLTLVEEITAEYNNTDYPNWTTGETNFNKGFGERSGRVIQNLDGGTILNFSAATLSDVKRNQPCLLSETYDYSAKKSSKQEQLQTIKRHLTYMQLKEKVRSFFKNTTFELTRELEENIKDSTDNYDASSFPFDLFNSKCIEPFPIQTVVQVVQVGQLPVSAAAQNPVTCDPRVTQVSDVSPSQCSVENSPHDDSQSEIKTEYTELTTADLNLPMVDDYTHHNQTVATDSQNTTNMSMNTENIPIETELVKSEVKIELVEEPSDEKENNELPDANNHINNVDYLYSANNTNPSVDTEFQSLFNSDKQDTSETIIQPKPQNGSSEKTDQIAHAMNAAGIMTTSETASTRAQALVNMLAQKLRQGAMATTPNSANNYPKATSINAMSLQQALASILPPPLNQTSSSENNQQSQNTPQVLHIVQGKNASGNQITLVDNTQQSVITNPNSTPVLHIVQNKTPASGQSNGSSAPQSNSFSGLSLVDAGLQQGGNQLLHIVNTGNQKNNNAAGQLLKRVNLLTNLANVQGSNEQKMLQFVCKSADGKSIQLNAPHQRSMVLRLQPIETPNVQPTTPKPTETNQDLSPTQNTTNSASNKDSAPTQQEIKSRSVYEENYAKFIQNSSNKPSLLEKSNSLPKFNQAFGKAVFQDGNQKQNEVNSNTLPSVNTSTENSECPATENTLNLDHMRRISSPPLLLRKPATQTTQAQQNLVQQIKQTIAPMNIQTMHGGVIYTRQIPVNIGGGQTINLITVPSTELMDESGQKQVNQGETIEPSIIKIVPQSQPPSNAEVSDDMNNDNAQQSTPQPQPVLTQMRIKLPMLSKAPQMVSGTRVVRPSFFQIQRNVIGGGNQAVYQQLVLTAAPPLGQQTIRLPQAQVRQIKVPENQSSSESQMSSSTLEQLREFDMVLEQVKERSTVQPNSNSGSSFKLNTSSTDTTDSPANAASTSVETTQVLYSIGSSQPLNVTYVNRKPSVATPTTSTFVRSPDSSGIADSPTSSSHSHIPHTSTSEASSSETTTQHHKSVKISSKSRSRPKSSSHGPNSMKLNSVPSKSSTQKPLEDEQTTQRILYILAEYKEQVENSPDKDKPAPRRRSNPPSNPGSSKRKKSSSGSRRSGRDVSPIHGEDTCRTMGSEDSSCGTSQGDCTESCMDSHSPQDSPRKVARKLAFDQDPPTPTQAKPQPQRNVIVADGQTITVARGTTGKPTTTVLMPTNYILPVSMVKGGQQIAIVTNRGPKLLTVGGGEGGATNALLLQRLIGPAGLKPVLTRPGVRHVRLPTAALHNLQAFNLATATSVNPPDSTASSAHESRSGLMDTNRAGQSPWTDRESEIKPDRASSPDEEPWNLPSSADPNDYSYEETVRTDNMDRTVLDPIQDRYSPDMEAQRIFDKMFDVDTKKSYIVDSHVDSPRCGYDIDASDCDDKPYQVVHKKDSSHRQTRLSHVSAAALRHKYAILEHELRLQKSLSEECEDLGVDSPSASELFPEAELLFAASPAQDHAGPDTPQHSHTPQPTLLSQSVIQPDIDDQIATDQLIPRHNIPEDRNDLGMGLEDVGIVTVSEDGMQATIALDQEEFARSHPNTTFHSEPTEEGEVQPFTITGLKGRHITSTIFHSNRAPATVLMTAPQTTVISQATTEPPHNPVKYSDIDNIIHSIPSTHSNNINLPSVLVKDDGLTRFDNILTDSRELHLSNTASAIVHSTGNATQVIRRVCYEDSKRERESFLMDEPDALIAGDDAKMIAEDSSRDATLESMGGDVDDDNSSPERHAELFWESNSASERSESRRPLEFSSDSEKCCKSPSYDETNSTDSSGVGTHMRLDSVIKEARGIERSGSADGSSAEDTHPPLRTYPPKRLYHNVEGEMERSLSGKTRAGERSPDIEVRRRASGRGVVKRGCHCCNGSPAPPRPKKPRQRKPTLDFNN